ncbi:MAG: dockerin type I repeat-containing protein [Clostridia bacterium]|nr:dockerin type I repeat-containing protein [Clostridia bacterium]
MFKKVISLVLALVMAMGVFAMNASAATDVVYGDVNKDGAINAGDALEVLQSSTGLKDLTNYNMAIADVNSDAKANSSDALLILQYATGLVLSFNKDYANTLKATKIDPVFANDAFTFSVAMEDESVGNFDMVFSTDGKSKAITSVINFQGILPIDLSMLHTNGKNYQVVGAIDVEILGKKERVEHTGTYCEIEENVDEIFDGYVRLFTSKAIFGSSVKRTVDGKEYVCETFYNEAGASFEYYFLNGKLAIATISNNGTTQTFKVTNLEKGVDASKLVIPSDYTEDDFFLKG